MGTRDAPIARGLQLIGAPAAARNEFGGRAASGVDAQSKPWVSKEESLACTPSEPVDDLALGDRTREFRESRVLEPVSRNPQRTSRRPPRGHPHKAELRP
jgi:hypothetical protein